MVRFLVPSLAGEMIIIKTNMARLLANWKHRPGENKYSNCLFFFYLKNRLENSLFPKLREFVHSLPYSWGRWVVAEYWPLPEGTGTWVVLSSMTPRPRPWVLWWGTGPVRLWPWWCCRSCLPTADRRKASWMCLRMTEEPPSFWVGWQIEFRKYGHAHLKSHNCLCHGDVYVK